MESFYVLDSRAGMLALENDGILDTDDNGKYLSFVGTLKECCDFANNKDYGEHNVVTNNNYKILWKLFNDNFRWSSKLYNTIYLVN
jgi:hypothetical protein